MIILGIDPGSQLFGLSMLEAEGNVPRFLLSRSLNLGCGELVERMKTLITGLEEFLKEHPVDSAAIEDGYLGKNVKTVEVLARIRGLVMTLLIQHSVPFGFYSPRTVKMAITGYGNADKEQVRKSLSLLLGSRVKDVSDDESDAMAVAYCHFLKG